MSDRVAYRVAFVGFSGSIGAALISVFGLR